MTTHTMVIETTTQASRSGAGLTGYYAVCTCGTRTPTSITERQARYDAPQWHARLTGHAATVKD